MRIAYVTTDRCIGNDSLMASGYANLPMIERMPVDVTACTSARKVRQYAPDMDVILLDLCASLEYRHELLFLNDLDVFVGGFHLDTWKGPYWCDARIEVDLNICIYREISLRVKPALAEGDKFLWLPPRVQLYDMNVERDIDVISWGHHGREYPFRLFCLYALINILTSGPRVQHPGIKYEYRKHMRIEDITLAGEQYKFARLLARYGAPFCHGSELAEILSRSKVNPTGPPIQSKYSAPVARYIENAACGVVSLTTEFDEKEDLGFEHGKNIWFTTAERFYSDLEYLLTDGDRWLEISQNARALVRERHTIDVRAAELYDVLSDRTGIV